LRRSRRPLAGGYAPAGFHGFIKQGCVEALAVGTDDAIDRPNLDAILCGSVPKKLGDPRYDIANLPDSGHRRASPSAVSPRRD